MTVKEFQYQFGIQMNQFDEALVLSSDDIQYWLNKAQIELVKEKYNGMNPKRVGFEQSQQRIDDLRVLLIRNHELDASFNADVAGTSDYLVDNVIFPSNYMFLISQKSKIIYNHPQINYTITNGKRVASGTSKVVSNRVALSDHIYTLLEDPFNKPKPSSPISLVHGNKISIFTDKTFIVDKVIIDYLKKPVNIDIKGNVTSELPEHMHEEIIQRAVDLFLNNTRQLKQRLQRETPTADKQTIENNE